MRISRIHLFLALAGFSALLGAVGCSPVSDTATPIQLPAICSSASQAAPATPFVFNMDYKRREEIVGVSVEWGKDDSGGVVWLDRLSLSVVAQLFEEGFIDPNDRQNSAPTSREILIFMCKYPSALASGYMVSPKRDDYRVTLDAIELPRRYVTPAAREEFEKLCKDADELITDGDLYCWWD